MPIYRLSKICYRYNKKEVSIYLYPNKTYSETINRTEMKGIYSVNVDTIFFTSEYNKDSIKLQNIKFDYVDSLSRDSLYFNYSLIVSKNTELSFIELYDSLTGEKGTYTPGEDRAIGKVDFTEFRVCFNGARSKFYAFELDDYSNYVSFKVDYPSRPYKYIFYDNDKFLKKGRELIRLEE